MLFRSVERKVAQAARRSALGAVAAIAFLVGLAFLTAAAWIAMAEAASTLAAALLIGFAYLALGAILIAAASAMGSRHHTPHVPEHDRPPSYAPPSGMPPLAQAFLYGMEAGSAAKRRERRR
ncbi:phage holin family protein [Pontibaca methylaminivorans]|uniref:Predicted membrane protein n=1 Tax=Pontibaca methylaminivorans TaxID=515897 RepID=A0A1R3WSF9_9RHOB|nr:phage holin family protein [Pontibaca methylaminivorans]SIT80216.1 Predicted membrane protein [Pontibaca methylaminivorans]